MKSESKTISAGVPETVRRKLPTHLVDGADKYPYITSDINTVAYLMMFGYKVSSIGRQEGDNKSAFCFLCNTPEDKEELRKHVRDYHNNVGNFRAYADAWRNAKGMVHNF